MENLYSLDAFKQNMRKYLDNGVGLEITLIFEDKKDEYYIVAYNNQRFEFGRSEYKTANYSVMSYEDLETLFNSIQFDGICLNRDWDKLTGLGCEPDMEYMDETIDAYRKAALKRKTT